MMKSAFLLGCLLAYFVGSTLGGVVHLSGKTKMSIAGKTKMSISGSVILNIKPPEGLWTGLSAARRFPIILSGDLIALKLARSSGTPKWLRCGKTAYCDVGNCAGAKYMTAAKFSSCRREVFRIRAFNKGDGQPVVSGDHVILTFPFWGETRHFYCYTPTSYQCRANWATSWPGNYWLHYGYATFRIFSRNAVDGFPVQLGDIVGFKFPYQSKNAWLYNSSNRFYARPCSNGHYNKYNCAKINTPTGFQIFKKL